MANDTNLKVDALEYSSIKTNLKEYLKSQDQFQDYNFESSGINALVDLLAYNTYYNAFYVNMAANESFLATAQKRDSVVNAAKSLNYTPRSKSSAGLTGTLTLFPTGTPTSISVPYGTRFSAVVDGVSYYFINLTPLTVFSSAGNYGLSGVLLTEGVVVGESYSYSTADQDQRFLINNVGADTSTLQVRVVNSTSDTTTNVYTLAGNVSSLSSDSFVYYLAEVEDGKYEVSFGDGIISDALDNGNIVYLDYVVSSGAKGNGILDVSMISSLAGVASVTFVADSYSFGGEDEETISAIKFNAPKSNAAQNRAVTAEDYETLVAQEPNVGSVLVWGGEDNDPPAYGKVFIAIRPAAGEVLTATEKEVIINSVIKPKKVLTVSAEIVDPEYIYLTMTVVTTYDPEQTIASEGDIKQKVIDTVTKYGTDQINQFSKYFRYSELLRKVDNSDRAILSSNIDVKMRKEFDVQLNSATLYTINFSNPINDVTRDRPTTHPFSVQNQITSNTFSYGGFDNCFLEDNNGILRIYRVTAGNDIVGVARDVGTIDYDTGKLVLSDFKPTAIGDGGVTLSITAVPKNKDILPLRGQILSIDLDEIDLTLVNDKTISLVSR
jgi:hypothetical protein